LRTHSFALYFVSAVLVGQGKKFLQCTASERSLLYESKTFGKTDLREVQGYKEKRQSYDYLRKP
jgi:hypothetical protein